MAEELHSKPGNYTVMCRLVDHITDTSPLFCWDGAGFRFALCSFTAASIAANTSSYIGSVIRIKQHMALGLFRYL